MQKKYILDTNVLLSDPNCITILYNGAENKIFIPRHVLLELDYLKKDNKKRHLVTKAINNIIKNKDIINILDCESIADKFNDRIDSFILSEIDSNNIKDGILVTNDKLLQFEANLYNIESQEYQEINPFKSESEKYNGFIEEHSEFIYNSFIWIEGKPYLNIDINNQKLVDYQHEIWKIKPKSVYQNLAFELILSDHIDIVSIQSAAGLGKTTLALASAFYLTFQKKKYNKIYITKPNIEIGQGLGFLPGDMEDKLAPYMAYLDDLILKIHKTRPINKLYKDGNSDTKEYNKNVFEVLPINFIRGRNIENAIIILDECQNLTRMETRTILSRFGENVKAICIGDTSQVDHPYLNNDNNGLNWIVKLFKNHNNYGHITLTGNKSRGPICDLVLKTGL
ncbi:MAG: PhoH family protein [bacterium]